MKKEENYLNNSIDLIGQWKGLANLDYSFYCEYVHEGRWLPGRHLLFICDEVQRLVEDRTDHQILIIQIPPQHGKSQSITETLPSWYLGKWPSKRVIEVSYGDDLARRFGRRNKQKIEQFGKELFDVELAQGSRSDTEFEIAGHKGSMISRGIMAGITGQPGDLIIIDDPIKNRQEADSETYRERLWEEWLNSIKTRLSAKGKVIVIMTRWHEDDLAGRIIKNEGSKVKVLNLPCEAEEDDPLGRTIGEPLFPEIGKDKAWLEDFKRSYTTEQGSRAWNALFQGRPTSQEGNMIKRSWWSYYEKELPMMQTIMSVDAAFKDGDDNDFVAIQVWGKRGPDMYLLDSLNQKLDFPGTLQAVQTMKSKHSKVSRIYIEDKANGSAVIQVLRRKITGIIPVNPEGGKVARVNAISGAIEAGNVLLPSDKPFTHDFVDQCSTFPNGKHDDMVDCMSQALSRLMFFGAEIPKDEEEESPDKYRKMVKEVTGGRIDRSFFNGGW